MAGEDDVPETLKVEKNGVAVAGHGEVREQFKGKRRAEQEAQVQAGKVKGQLPKKRFYRARAHSNPLSDCQFSVYVQLPLSPPSSPESLVKLELKLKL